MGKKSKKPSSEIAYGAITVGMTVTLKKQFVCKVTSVEKMKAKKGGFKVRITGTEASTGTIIIDVKPVDRITDTGTGDAFKKKGKGSANLAAKAKSLADYDMSKGAAGTAMTVPIRAGEVRKGSFLMMKGKPCKVIEISISKTGKHGHAKANIVGLDVFTNRKYNEISPTSHNMTAPAMYRSEWQLTDVSREGTMTLMDPNGNTRSDLDLPKDTHNEFTPLSQQIFTRFASLPDDKALFCVVLKAMTTEQVIDMIVKDQNAQ